MTKSRTKQKIFSIMKINFIQLVIAGILAGNACATPVKAQEQLQKKVTLSLKKSNFRTLLKTIERQTDVFFSFQKDLLSNNELITVEIKNEKLEDVLKKVLIPRSIAYETVGDRQIILTRTKNTGYQEIPMTQPLKFPEAESNNILGEISVSGVVTDENGQGLPGVNIAIKGTNRGVNSTANGSFKISVPNTDAVLIFSFVGYISQEIEVGSKNTINVSLKTDDRALDEVVVVGYGTQKKANLTGAVSTIDSKLIENRPVSNVANALQGVASGLIVTRGSGQPGNEGIGIQIRGATSANGNVDPLILVDGVTVSSFTLQTLNPNDIESISVLKDAAAAAIYGAQAAGGVLLITTKKGKSGKTIFEYSNQIGVDWALNVPERLSLLDEAEYANLARKNAKTAPEYTEEDLQRIRDGIPYVVNPSDTTRYIFYNQENQINSVVRKYTPMQTHNFSAKGGTEKTNYLVSFGYYGKQGLFKVGPDRLDRYNLRVNLGSQLTKHISLDSRIAYSLQSQQASSVGTDGEGLVYQIYRLRTRFPIFTPEGRLNGGAGSSSNNSYALLKEGGYNNVDRNFFDGVFTLAAKELVKGLNIRTVLGQQYRFSDRRRFARQVELWGRFAPIFYLNNPNQYAITSEFTRNTNIQFLTDYDLTIGKSKFHVLGGYQWEDSRFTSTATTSNSLVNNDQPTLNLGDDKTKANSETINTFAFQSFFGRFNYNYDDKYLFEATFRMDESSRLAPGLRNKFFPSASIGWNMQREPWFSKAVPLFSEFKLRGSWGQLGNALGIGYYDYLNLLNRGSNLVLGGVESRTSYFSQSVVPSSDLSWETIETSNFGLDMGLVKNKLQISGDYYIKYNRNMLTPLQLPATFGVGTPRINNGELKSWGWEVEVKFRDKIGESFNYNIGLNISDNQNKLISYAGRRVVGAGTVALLEGYPLNSIWGYKTAGYFQTDDEVKASAFQDSRTGAGDVRFVDQNGDAKINVGKGSPDDSGDLVYLGTDQPRYVFGFNIGFQYKGFDFSAFIQGVGKRSFLANSEAIEPLAQAWKQPLAIHKDYWTPENQDATFPRPYLQGGFRYLPSDKWMINGQYARLKNIQIGYSLPEKWIKKIKVSRARVFVSGQDILSFTRLGAFNNYFNPEQRNGAQNDYPFFGTATAGLNLSF